HGSYDPHDYILPPPLKSISLLCFSQEDAELFLLRRELKTSAKVVPTNLDQILFRKFLEYEKYGGDEERVEYVKQRAMEYADSILA
ncbi:unnamed protein product, partial [Brassica napus]